MGFQHWASKIFGPRRRKDNKPLTKRDTYDVSSFEPVCLNCNAIMKSIEISQTPLGGSSEKCSNCGEKYHATFMNGKLTLRRVSVPSGFDGITEKTFLPVTSVERRENAVSTETLLTLIEKGLSLPLDKKIHYFSTIGEHMHGLTSEQIMEVAEKIKDNSIYHIAFLLCSLQLNLISESDLYYAWYQVAISFNKLSMVQQAKSCAVKSLLYIDNPNALSWNLLSSYCPDIPWDAMSSDEKKLKVMELINDFSKDIPQSSSQIKNMMQEVMVFGGWKYSPPSSIKDISMGEDKIFINLDEEGIYCLSMENGELLWKVLEKKKNIEKIKLSNNLLFALSNNKIYKIKQRDGSIEWESDFPFNDIYHNSPIANFGDYLVFAIQHKGSLKLACIDTENKKEMFRIKLKTSSGLQFFANKESINRAIIKTDEDFFSIQLETGEKIWDLSDKWEEFDWADILVHNGFLYITTKENISCIKCSTGEIIWQKNKINYQNEEIYPEDWKRLACFGDRVFTIAEFYDDRYFLSLRASDGEIKWCKNLGWLGGDIKKILVLGTKVFLVFPYVIRTHNVKDGSMLWNYEESTSGLCLTEDIFRCNEKTLLIVKRSYNFTTERGYICLNIDDGNLRSSKQIEIEMSILNYDCVKVIEDGLIYATDKQILKLDI